MFAHPNRYPTNYVPSRERHVMSPFWGDNDIRKEGTIRYVTMQKGDSHAKDVIFNNITDFVNEELTAEGEVFEGNWAIVAQWEDVHPHPHGADPLPEGIDKTYLDRVRMSLLGFNFHSTKNWIYMGVNAM